RLPRRLPGHPPGGRGVQPGLHARAQPDLQRGPPADGRGCVGAEALLRRRDLGRRHGVLRGVVAEGRRRHLDGEARAVRTGEDDGAVGQRAPGRSGRDRQRDAPGAGRPQVAGRQRDRVRMRAVQRRGARRRRQQVAAVEDAAADVPPRVELGHQPAALDPGDRGGGVEGGRRGVGLRHVRQGARVESMEYTHLGRSGLSVSRLCLGTMNFGWQTPEEDSHAIMDRALQEGINFFDTANVYGFSEGKGRPEEVIGTWFAQGGERRDRTVLATKVYGGMTDWPNDTFLSARNIVRACEASLRRLQTDWIDLYQFHHVDLQTPWEEIWQACE